jgi:hypothetical protein
MPNLNKLLSASVVRQDTGKGHYSVPLRQSPDCDEWIDLRDCVNEGFVRLLGFF